eukprot:TRINITY_DN13891_c0_g6_i1.p1 TRINITY_DN13891_c0_g6~~TRINITY_DN13891_c0_g6_i1.p1  ORF type:complete len:251 (-),score=0.28 TRINITY_DN13891_c0_g6_i1:22-774(-)
MNKQELHKYNIISQFQRSNQLLYPNTRNIPKIYYTQNTKKLHANILNTKSNQLITYIRRQQKTTENKLNYHLLRYHPYKRRQAKTYIYSIYKSLYPQIAQALDHSRLQLQKYSLLYQYCRYYYQYCYLLSKIKKMNKYDIKKMKINDENNKKKEFHQRRLNSLQRSSCIDYFEKISSSFFALVIQMQIHGLHCEICVSQSKRQIPGLHCEIYTVIGKCRNSRYLRTEVAFRTRISKKFERIYCEAGKLVI